MLMTRNKKNAEQLRLKVDELVEYPIGNNYIDVRQLENTDIIINLSGESILGFRWTERKKKAILNSRLRSIKLINESLKYHNLKIPLLIYASATGYYGYSQSHKAVDENSSSGHGFLAQVCVELENQVMSGSSYFHRISILRFGTILGSEKFIKMISKGFALPFIGFTIGKGQQWFPYIHIEDVVMGIDFVINNNSLKGPINFVSDENIRYKDFIHIFKTRKKVRLLISIPGIFISLILGDMSELITKGIRVTPDKLIKSGYKFKNITSSLEDILNEEKSHN
jgi:uncharacterized protein (TIGR01777 family)